MFGITASHRQIGIAEAVGGITIVAGARDYAWSLETGVAFGIEGSDLLEAFPGFFRRRCYFIDSCDEDDVTGAECDRSDPVADHVDPVQRTIGADGIDSRQEKIGGHPLAANFPALLARHIRLETVIEAD